MTELSKAAEEGRAKVAAAQQLMTPEDIALHGQELGAALASAHAAYSKYLGLFRTQQTAIRRVQSLFASHHKTAARRLLATIVEGLADEHMTIPDIDPLLSPEPKRTPFHGRD